MLQSHFQQGTPITATATHERWFDLFPVGDDGRLWLACYHDLEQWDGDHGLMPDPLQPQPLLSETATVSVGLVDGRSRDTVLARRRWSAPAGPWGVIRLAAADAAHLDRAGARGQHAELR